MVIAGLVAATTLAACGSPPPEDPKVDLSQLEVGNYPTQPQVLGKVHDKDQAYLVEAARLGSYVPLPSEIDRRLQYNSSHAGTVHPFTDPSASGLHNVVAASRDEFNEDANGFLFGFINSGRSNRVTNLSFELTAAVLTFSNDATATSAADALFKRDMARSHGAEPTILQKYTTARTYFTPQFSWLTTFFATGQFVILSIIRDRAGEQIRVNDLDTLTDLATRSLDITSDRLRDFVPTPPEKLLDLPADIDGMLGRAIPANINPTDVDGPPAVYDRHGALSISYQPLSDATLFDAAGVDRVAFNGSYIYRAKDAAGARTVANQYANPGRVYRRIDPPKGLPMATCLEYRGMVDTVIKYTCTVSVDRYAAAIRANQLRDAYQRISAQYAVLINSR
ncbi:DUF7373 family lipoprotein [Nocardia panacis]|uniref:DUF7373 family lipoprotein n=1 Tax=Nocardia panacis TaxID=2340916 RepID=UPI003F6F4FD6